MALKLYNFLTRKKEVFKPINDKIVGLYACGPTVYNYAHIGNLKTYIFEDVLKRTLEFNEYEVRHVMNITDIEDKIIRDSKKAKKSISEFVKPYEKVFFEDLKKLNIEKAWKYPKATKHIRDMVKIIEALIKKGLAYKANNSIYFDISKFKSYGKLSGLKSRELKTGNRADTDEYGKEDADDFVLWKAAKTDEPSWNAPFGKGRPGWHIECSTMSMKYLGETFDIHTGAVDLIFPHHENEIAQSEGATGKPFVRYFIEGEHLLIDNEKMSKSLGNIYSLRDIEIKGFDPLSFRYLVLTAHYQSKLNFTWESLAAAQNALKKLKESVVKTKSEAKKSAISKIDFNKYRDKFLSLINNNLETPIALAFLWDIIKSEKLNAKTKYNLIIDFDKVFGLHLDKIKTEKIPAPVLKLAEERKKYRKENDFTAADELRKKIEKLGWLVEDTPTGPVVKKK